MWRVHAAETSSPLRGDDVPGRNRAKIGVDGGLDPRDDHLETNTPIQTPRKQMQHSLFLSCLTEDPEVFPFGGSNGHTNVGT